jgi:superfamily II DNA helicase RecQ
MYTHKTVYPKKFGSHTSLKAKPSFGRGKFSNSHSHSFKRVGANKKSRGERIDFSRFIKKGTLIEEKPYIAKHSFADFSFNEQLHKNIERAGFKSPRPIQDQAIPSVMKGHDVFGMANTGTGKQRHFSSRL